MDSEQLASFVKRMSGESTSSSVSEADVNKMMEIVDALIENAKKDGFSNYYTLDEERLNVPGRSMRQEQRLELQNKVKEQLERRNMVVQMKEPRRPYYGGSDIYLKDMKIVWEDVPASKMDQSKWTADERAYLASLMREVEEDIDATKSDGDFDYVLVKWRSFRSNLAYQKHVIDTFRARGYTVTMEEAKNKPPYDLTWNVRISWTLSNKKK